eukprot:1714486-Prymnesium_polylepis.1
MHRMNRVALNHANVRGRLIFMEALAGKEETHRCGRHALALAEGVHRLRKRRRRVALEKDRLAFRRDNLE